jgi:hypothetical protein
MERCVKDWLDSVEYGLRTTARLIGQAEKWIYPRIGATKVKDFSATDSRSGDAKAPKSKRSLELPNRAVKALQAHKERQARERERAGSAWHDNSLVSCRENGDPCSRDGLSSRFSTMTRRASATDTPTRAGAPPCPS